MKLISKFFTISFFILIVILNSFQDLFFQPVLAQENNSQTKEETLEAEVIKIIDEQTKEILDQNQIAQTLQLKITKGSLKDEIIQIETGKYPTVAQIIYKVGDQLVIRWDNFQGKDNFQIADYVRRDPLIALFLIFFILTILVAKKKGLTSILGMLISFLIIFSFILPQINKGANPIFISILASLLLIPVTFYLSHGFNRKTSIAIFGTLISLIITSILASIFVTEMKLTGFATEEASFLFSAKGELINMKSLLLSGIIIGLLGILDDITIAQASVVFKLREANPKFNLNSLYQKSMEVGGDHIASMVNTLILVYTGGALPLFLLFINSPRPFSEVINYEQIAAELTTMLLGSIGLIIAVPITTFLACLKSAKQKF